MAKECANKRKCPCTYAGCSRHGRCCECLAHHLEHDELPGCCFPADIEASGDRSFRKFAELHAKR